MLSQYVSISQMLGKLSNFLRTSGISAHLLKTNKIPSGHTFFSLYMEEFMVDVTLCILSTPMGIPISSTVANGVMDELEATVIAK